MIAIRGGTVYTMAGPPIPNGTVLIAEGKIVSVGGAELPVPSGTEIIGAAGCWVTPGFIDAHSHLALWGEPELPMTADENELTDPITPHIRARDRINPHDIGIAKVRTAGFTAVYTGPGSGNLIGGLGACIKLRGTTADEMIIPGTEQMKMALGENPKRVYGTKNKFPMTRMGNAALLRQTLSRARDYADRRTAVQQDSGAPERDFVLESLLPVLRGETRVRIHCHRADDIITASRICEEFGLVYSLEHVTEGWKVADTLAAKHAECVLGPVLLGPAKQELWESRLENAAILQRKGVRFCLMADKAGETKWLPMEIGVLLRHGLDLDTALQAVTVNPARLVGALDRMGTLETGKDADIAVFDGMPFSNLTLCRLTMIDGKVWHDTLSEPQPPVRSD